MADSYSQFLKVTLPATGAYNNTWGTVLNTDTFGLLDAAITGYTTESIGTNITYSLPALTSGAASDSRYFCLQFVGTPASQVTVTVPGSVNGKQYLIANYTGQSLLFTYVGSNNTVTVPNGAYQLIWCDGANVWAVSAQASNSPSLGGVPAANWVQGTYDAAQIAAGTIVQNLIELPTAWPWYSVADAPSITFNCQNGNAQSVTIAGNRSITAPTNAVDGSELWLLVVQDGTGSRTLTWNTVFWFENGEAPTLASTPGGADVFLCRYNQALNKWLVAQFYNLNAGAGTSSTITINENCQDWSLVANVGALSAPQIINIIVEQGVVIEASSPAIPAMNLGGIPSGSTVNITNHGFILGHGGDGGRGGAWVGGVSFGFQLRSTAGKAGGPSISGPGSGVTFNLTNYGYIWGGGGGGGAGGWSSNAGANNQVASGGGGGGAGLGKGGIAFSFGDANGYVSPSDGSDGNFALSPTGAFGAAGAGSVTGTANYGASGAGGGWGAAGAAGTAAGTSYTVTGTAGAGGAAGSAIQLNGGGITITPSAGSTSPQIKGAVA